MPAKPPLLKKARLPNDDPVPVMFPGQVMETRDIVSSISCKFRLENREVVAIVVDYHI